MILILDTVFIKLIFISFVFFRFNTDEPISTLIVCKNIAFEVRICTMLNYLTKINAKFLQNHKSHVYERTDFSAGHFFRTFQRSLQDISIFEIVINTDLPYEGFRVYVIGN